MDGNKMINEEEIKFVVNYILYFIEHEKLILIQLIKSD